MYIMEQPKGLIIIAEEHTNHVVVKYVGWLAIMVIFVLFLLWFSKFFAHPECNLAIRHTYRNN